MKTNLIKIVYLHVFTWQLRGYIFKIDRLNIQRNEVILYLEGTCTWIVEQHSIFLVFFFSEILLAWMHFHSEQKLPLRQDEASLILKVREELLCMPSRILVSTSSCHGFHALVFYIHVVEFEWPLGFCSLFSMNSCLMVYEPQQRFK